MVRYASDDAIGRAMTNYLEVMKDTHRERLRMAVEARKQDYDNITLNRMKKAAEYIGKLAKEYEKVIEMEERISHKFELAYERNLEDFD